MKVLGHKEQGIFWTRGVPSAVLTNKTGQAMSLEIELPAPLAHGEIPKPPTSHLMIEVVSEEFLSVGAMPKSVRTLMANESVSFEAKNLVTVNLVNRTDATLEVNEAHSGEKLDLTIQ